MDTRQKILKVSKDAKACHIGSALSCVEILEVIDDVKGDDIFIFGKASGVGAYYVMKHSLKRATELLRAHPLPSKEAGLLWSGGSLGQALSVACGIALTGKKVYVLLSDGEMQEGQTWEAAMFAAHHKLPIVAFVDKNGFQALGKTKDIINIDPLEEKFQAFGWATRTVDGHKKWEIKEAIGIKTPKVVICETVKGKGVPYMENNNLWHYKNLDG